jgi:hypothetical protein
VADHLGLDFDLVELLSGVDTDDAADHLGDDNHVTEVGLDEVGLLVGLGLLCSGLVVSLQLCGQCCLRLDFLSFLMRPMGLRLRPRLNLRRARAWTRSRSSSEPRSRSLHIDQNTATICIHSPSLSESRGGSGDVLVEVNAAVRELAERPLRLKGCWIR